MASATHAPSTVPRAAFLAMLMVAGCLVHSDSIAPMSRRIRDLPRLTLWAWERPEDLSGIDSRETAVAYLDQTLLLRSDGKVLAEPRMQPVAFPVETSQIAVARIEVEPGTLLSSAIRRQSLEYLLHSARQPGIAAFQVDFDATRSQRGFYRDLLVDLRHEMPPSLPLSITALASWCSWDDWIRDLPVDEAVPMFFRMEPDRRRSEANRSEYRIRERLCLGSVGVSTREPWPEDEISSRRVYLFPDRGWKQDAALRTAETRWMRLP